MKTSDKEMAPALHRQVTARSPDQEEKLLIETSVPKRTTRNHRSDHAFLEILEEDFGISRFALRSSFMGVPAAPKRQAIALCEWAVRVTGGNPGEAGDALRAWAKKHGQGRYDRRLVEAPEITYEHNEHLRRTGRL